MGVILRKEESLKKQYKNALLWTLVLLPGGVLVTWLGMPNLVVQIIGLCMIIVGGNFGYRFIRFYRGSRGEGKVTKQLERLPDNYIAINDTVIPNGDRTAQIDHILIADCGIFCIETKSHRGTIYGNEDDHDWKQVKKAESGRKYTNMFYNPVKQCITHAMALKSLLKDNGFDMFIQPVVVFTTDSTVLKVKTRTPVIKVNELYDYIMRYPHSHIVSDEEKQRIADIVLNNVINDKKVRSRLSNGTYLGDKGGYW